MRDYSWSMTVITADGKLNHLNQDNAGYRRSWYKTEEGARKGLRNQRKISVYLGETIVSWMIFNRNHDIGVIETWERRQQQ